MHEINTSICRYDSVLAVCEVSQKGGRRYFSDYIDTLFGWIISVKYWLIGIANISVNCPGGSLLILIWYGFQKSFCNRREWFRDMIILYVLLNVFRMWRHLPKPMKMRWWNFGRDWDIIPVHAIFMRRPVAWTVCFLKLIPKY